MPSKVENQEAQGAPSLPSFPLLLTEPKHPTPPSWFTQKGQALLTPYPFRGRYAFILLSLGFSFPWVSIPAVRGHPAPSPPPARWMAPLQKGTFGD